MYANSATKQGIIRLRGIHVIIQSAQTINQQIIMLPNSELILPANSQDSTFSEQLDSQKIDSQNSYNKQGLYVSKQDLSMATTLSVSNYRSFDFFNIKFDHSYYSIFFTNIVTFMSFLKNMY